MAKATANGWTKEKIQDLLSTNDRAVERALIQIYNRQTADEQSSRDTRENNSRGFTAFDAEFMTSLAQGCIKYNGLTDKQMGYARKRIMKYWKQLMEIAEAHPKQAPATIERKAA